MRASLSQLGNILPIPKLFRQLEQEMETVIKVLQPGPLGIIEHKFSAEEIREANATVRRAVENWRRNAIIEQRNGCWDDSCTVMWLSALNLIPPGICYEPLDSKQIHATITLPAHSKSYCVVSTTVFYVLNVPWSVFIVKLQCQVKVQATE
ncbi:hypothetical protein V6N13_045320 [Hibiscus sabdariffa]